MIDGKYIFFLAFQCIFVMEKEKKKEILQWNIQKRSRAHDIIKKMLASLGDPYTRFLAPSEVIGLSLFSLQLGCFKMFLWTKLKFIFILSACLSFEYYNSFLEVGTLF